MPSNRHNPARQRQSRASRTLAFRADATARRIRRVGEPAWSEGVRRGGPDCGADEESSIKPRG